MGKITDIFFFIVDLYTDSAHDRNHTSFVPARIRQTASQKTAKFFGQMMLEKLVRKLHGRINSWQGWNVEICFDWRGGLLARNSFG